MVVAAFSVKVTAAIWSRRAVPAAHERLDAVHEQRRLAGARARLQDEARSEVAPGPLAGRFVRGAEARSSHRPPT